MSVDDEEEYWRMRFDNASYCVKRSRRRLRTLWASSNWAFVGRVSLSLKNNIRYFILEGILEDKYK